MVYEDMEGEMVVGDLEPEPADSVAAPHPRSRQDHGSVREDAEDIVNGTTAWLLSTCKASLT